MLGNTTASPATVSVFTIGNLTNKASPTGSDILILQDQAASGALKYCTIAQCVSSSVAGVASINSLSGALIVANGVGVMVASGGTTIKVSAPVHPPAGTFDFDKSHAGHAYKHPECNHHLLRLLSWWKHGSLL